MTHMNQCYLRCSGIARLRDCPERLHGIVGQQHTMIEWLRIIYPKRDEYFLYDFFGHYTKNQIKKYIFNAKTIRLEDCE